MILRGRLLVVLGALALAAACDGSSGSDAGPGDGGPRPAFSPTHTFPAIPVEAGGEVQNLCQSWTLNNPEPIWVSSVTMDAEPGWHHSNWMFVPETEFEGPDGTWPCADRMFNEITASLAGGAVFFAQSTQSTHEEMSFPAGAGYEIPAYSRIIGGVHLINYDGAATESALTFTIGAVPEAEITTPLFPLALDNRAIRIAPRGTAASVTECDFRGPSGGAIGWSIYYVLPHYHAMATAFTLEAVGGPMDGTVVYETSLDVGDPLGAPLSPPFDLTGATGLRLRCDYQNSGTTEVRYGPDATDEMCVMLAYTTAGVAMAGAAAVETTSTTLPDGTVEIHSDCYEIARPIGAR